MKSWIFCLSLIPLTAAADFRPEIRKAVDSLSPESCSSVLDNLAKKLDHLKVEDFKEEIKADSHERLLEDLWSQKVALHEKLRSFYKNKNYNLECATSFRGTFRALRTTEDFLHEDFRRTQATNMSFPDNAFTEGNLHVRRHPEFSKLNLTKDLKSGDIILSRGNAYTSAAIANLGEFDTQFSHMSVVYKNEKGEFWTIEAHIEVGSFVRTLQEHADDKNFRTMFFRFEDEAIAAKAADYIFHKVKKASDTTGNILYDFGFNQDESQKLFCSEVASHAFDVVSMGEVKLPLFRSRLLTRKPTFVKKLAIEAAESFIPADLEVDPRFKMIAEWRDGNKIDDSLQKDAILQAMYRWNDELGYQMIQASSVDSLIYRNFAWPLRRVPYLKKYFVKKLPLNMSRKLIGYFGVLESVGKLLQKKLKAEDEKTLGARQFPMLSTEKYDFLDGVRVEDLKSKSKKMHFMYHPKKPSSK